jgi:Activator of Hsp90 ATPase homolog 1-like protein
MSRTLIYHVRFLRCLQLGDTSIPKPVEPSWQLIKKAHQELMEQTMLDPIISTIEVPCTQEKAFGVFVNDMGSWWPLDKRSMSMRNSGKPAKSLRLEPKLGGKIVETGHDDSEHLWGTITSYDPHELVRMDFHMGLPPETASLVEVRFTALEHDRTRVELTQSNWEAFGDLAEQMRGGYGSSWLIIFEQAFKSACGG